MEYYSVRSVSERVAMYKVMQMRPRVVVKNFTMPLEVGRFTERLLLPHLVPQFQTDDPLRLVADIVLHYLGPAGAGPAPDELRDEFQRHVDSAVRAKPEAEQVAALVWLAKYYGMGWQRHVRSGNAHWDGRWPTAEQSMQESAVLLVVNSCKRLACAVRGFRELYWARLRKHEVRACADYVVAKFTHETPLRPANCRPPRSGVEPRYNLCNWYGYFNPHKGSGAVILKCAMRGFGKGKGLPLPNRFVTSWIYDYLQLETEARLLVARTAFQQCETCGSTLALPEQPLVVTPHPEQEEDEPERDEDGGYLSSIGDSVDSEDEDDPQAEEFEAEEDVEEDTPNPKQPKKPKCSEYDGGLCQNCGHVPIVFGRNWYVMERLYAGMPFYRCMKCNNLTPAHEVEKTKQCRQCKEKGTLSNVPSTLMVQEKYSYEGMELRALKRRSHK